MRRVPCSDWLPKPLGIVVFDPAQEEEVHGAVIFWAISAMKSQKTAEESHNKENIKNPRGFIVLQTQMSFSLGSGNR